MMTNRVWAWVSSRIQAMRRESSEPLFKAGHSLILSSVITSVIGLAFWVLAAHRYRPSVVGANSVSITILALLSGAAQLNLAGALTRFVPVAGEKRGRLILAAYATSAGLSIFFAVGFLIVATDISPSFAFLRSGLGTELCWVVGVIAWGIFVIEDGALIGLRRAQWVPIENAGFSVLKLVLVVLLAAHYRQDGIFLAWAAATVATVIPLNVLLFSRAVSSERRRAPEGDLSIPHLFRYVAYDYLASLAWLCATSLVPLMVVRRVGASSSAYFTLSWLIIYVLYLVSINVGSSLIAETATMGEAIEAQAWRTIRHLYRLLVPAVVVLELSAGLILRLFGSPYAAAGTATLRILAISALPFVITSTAVSVLRSRRNTRAVLAIDGVMCAGVLGLSWLLLPHFGTEGAAAAWLIFQLAMAGYLLVQRQWLPNKNERGLSLRLAGLVVSSPYIELASELRARFATAKADRWFSQIYPQLASELAATCPAGSYMTASAHVQPSASDTTVALLESPVGQTVGVVKIPRSERALVDLQHGSDIVRSLAENERLGSWRSLVPSATLHRCPATHFSLEPHIKGRSAADFLVLEPVRVVELVRLALRSIGEMHAATARLAFVDENEFHQLIFRSKALREQHPSGRVPSSQVEAVAAVEARLRDAVLGRLVELSYVHGDYTTGNVLFNDDGSEVTGILDWGQARDNGLPALDVVSLIATTYCRLEHLQLGGFVAGQLEGEPWPSNALFALASDAIERSGIANKELLLWSWLEHITCNLEKSCRYERSPIWWAGNVEPVLRALQ